MEAGLNIWVIKVTDIFALGNIITARYYNILTAAITVYTLTTSKY